MNYKDRYNQVVLVDKHNNSCGICEKMTAHIEGYLHRAVSVLIVNDQNQMLLHQRSSDKYHCPELWTNACCTHPFENEATIDSAHRRLKEEMGITTELKHLFDFVYRAKFENGLIEHEYDSVYLGIYNEDPIINPKEAMDYKWIDIDTLKKDIKINSSKYTKWFQIIVNDYLGEIL